MIIALTWFLVLPLSLSLGYFALEVILGLKPVKLHVAHNASASVVVVVPAHNEAVVVADTVRALRETLLSSTVLLLVADNCSDGTAAIARDSGATVVERNDPSRRGKGFAIAFARDYLAADPPAAVIIFDADCRIKRGSLEALAASALEFGLPMQCVNLLEAPQGASPLVLLSNFAMRVKNLVRARGLYRVGGGIPLFGTGMAFPWSIFETLDLATSDAVEDVRLSLDLAMAGVPVRLSEAVEVVSPAAPLNDSLGQRSRWEHGFLSSAIERGLPLLFAGVARRSRHLIALGMHMLVPPLVLLFLISGVAAMIAFGSALVTGTWAPLLVLMLALGVALMATFVAWVREGRDVLGLTALIKAPLYVLWKIPLYLSFFSARQTKWNRTRRSTGRMEPPAPPNPEDTRSIE